MIQVFKVLPLVLPNSFAESLFSKISIPVTMFTDFYVKFVGGLQTMAKYIFKFWVEQYIHLDSALAKIMTEKYVKCASREYLFFVKLKENTHDFEELI